MGKAITFYGFLLALLCLIPVAVYKLLGFDGPLPNVVATITLVGFPLFSLVSFIGMMVWTITEISHAGANRKGREK